MKTKTFRGIFGTFSILALAFGVGVAIRSVSAGSGDNVFGFAWGGNEAVDSNGASVPNNGVIDGDESGLGWISFNDTDVKPFCDADNNNFTDVACGGLNTNATPWQAYGVNIPVGDGPLSGYAWSENFGWISFDGANLVGCAPALSQATRTGNTITGGARILSIRDAGANAGGFDGCVSLSGVATNGSPYGVTVVGTNLSGYAWSSDLGWIDMSGAVGAATPTLKICLGSVYLGKATASGTTLTTRTLPTIGNSETLNAWSGTDNGICDGTDVTATTTWNDEAGNTAVNVTGTSTPSVTITANAIGSETVSIPNATASPRISIPYNVPAPSCTSNCNAEKGNHCQGETFTTNDSCGVSETCTNAGTRYCDFNWKEVRPGQ